MVILEVLEPSQSAAKGTESDREREVAAGSTLVLCDFEPLQKTSPSVALALLTGGHHNNFLCSVGDDCMLMSKGVGLSVQEKWRAACVNGDWKRFLARRVYWA